MYSCSMKSQRPLAHENDAYAGSMRPETGSPISSVL